MTRTTRLGLLASAATIVLIAAVVVIVVKTRQSVDHYKQGLALWQQGDLDAAIASLNKAIVQKPAHAKLFTTRGMVNYDKGNLDQAIDDFTSALQFDANDGDARDVGGVRITKRTISTKPWTT